MFSADKSPVVAKKNTINLGKLSLALKMSPSPVERFMPADGGQVNNIASILHEKEHRTQENSSQLPYN